MSMTEKAIQNKIIKDLKAKGYWVIKTQGGVAGTPIGTPDILACDIIGNFIAIEVKKIGGKLSIEQVHQLKKLSNNLASTYVTNDINFGFNIERNQNIEEKSSAIFDDVVTYQIYCGDIYEVIYD